MRSTIASMAILAGFIAGAMGAATTKEQLLAEYEPPAGRLRDFYTSTKMTGEYQQTWISARDPNKLTHFADNFTLWTDGERLRMDSTRLEGPRIDKPQRRSVVNGKEQSFVVSNDTKQDAFVLDALSPRERDDGHGSKLRFYGAFAPYIDTDGVTYLDRFKEPTTEILEVTEENRGDDAVVTVSARFRRTGLPVNLNSSPDFTGSFTFLKNKSWALAEARWEQKDAKYGPMRCQVTYEGEQNGIPLLKHSEYWVERPSGDVKSVDCQVTELVPGPPPQREFTLAAFGIHDVGEEKEPNAYYWLYLIGGGVILIAAAIIVARVGVRRRSAG